MEPLEQQIRMKISTAFDDAVSDISDLPQAKGLLDDPLFGGMAVRSALDNLFNSLADDKKTMLLAFLYKHQGLDYYKILEEEYHNALDRHLETVK